MRAVVWAMTGLAICMLLPAPVQAQDAAPTGSMFGSVRVNPRSTQRLSLTLRADEGHDSEMLTSSSLQAAVRFTRNRNKQTFVVNADSSVHHYPGAGGITAFTHNMSG